MEQWSVQEDRPYLREGRREGRHAAHVWWLFFLALALAAGGAIYYLWSRQELIPGSPLSQPSPPPAEVASAAPPAPQDAKPAPAPAIEADPAKPLPSLDNSDALMRETVSGLVGRKAFEAMVYPTQLVRRIVATVDNLPRETAPRRVMPLEPVPGRFGVSTAGEEYLLAGANAERYGPYVRVFQGLDARTLARSYFASYGLFQRAYAELGFPNQRFHDRLIEALDDLLEAPEVSGPVKLVRPKVFYEFADPEMESLSAGQKIMIRMGTQNAAKVKAKLREIRRELTTPRSG